MEVAMGDQVLGLQGGFRQQRQQAADGVNEVSSTRAQALELRPSFKASGNAQAPLALLR